MPTNERNDPYRNFRFKVEINGITLKGGFSDATIPDSSTEPVDYREGHEDPWQRKLSGLTKYGSLTLKKGLVDSMELYNWRKQVEQSGANKNRKDISLILVDEEGKDSCRWDILAAWPTKYSSSGFEAKGNAVMIETFELALEKITRMK